MSKFKVGDKVKIIKNEVYGHEVGIIGIIKHIDKNDYGIEDSKGDIYYHYETDLKQYIEFKVDTMNGMMGSEYDNIEEFPKTIQPIIINPTVKVDDKIIEQLDRAYEKAMRFNSGKPKVSLIHNASLEPMVRVLEYGSKKYAPHNWKKPMDKIELLESLKRHVDDLIDAVNAGTSELDPESGEHLIGNVLCNAMFYSYHNVIKK